MTPPSRNSDDWPVHQPEATDAPIPGRQWYSGCEPGGDLDIESGHYEGTGPRLNPATGRCTGCGEPGCRVCGRQDCPDHSAADQAHAAAESLEPDATDEEVLAVLAAYKDAWWGDRPALSPGTLAWFLADFLPAWLGSAAAEYEALTPA